MRPTDKDKHEGKNRVSSYLETHVMFSYVAKEYNISFYKNSGISQSALLHLSQK
jgi:hypothetical protein